MQDKFIKFLAVFQLIGGVWGTILWYYYLAGVAITPLMLLLLSFCTLEIYSGVELWRGSKKGYNLSLINLSLQIFQFSGPFFSFVNYAVLGVLIGFYGFNPFQFNISTELTISLNNPDAIFGVAINIVPIVLLYLLNKREHLFEKAENNQESD